MFTWRDASRFGSFLIIVMILLPSCRSLLPTPQTAHEGHAIESVESETALLSILYEMLGHLEASGANLERGNWTLAQEHAEHTTAEYWAAIEPALATRCLTAVRSPLDAYFTATRSQSVDSTTHLEAARQALRDAIAAIAGTGPESTRTLAAALAELAESIAAEFAEGVENDQIVNLEEYQDAWGFFQVLSAELPRVLDVAPTSGREAAAEARADLESLSRGPFNQFIDQPGTRVIDADSASERLAHLASVIRDAFGISKSTGPTLAVQVATIRQMLSDALNLYRSGLTDQAYERAANAYLQGFEALEPALLERGHRELVERLELDFKAVRDAIRDGRSVKEIAQLIAKVNAGLDEVEEVLA